MKCLENLLASNRILRNDPLTSNRILRNYRLISKIRNLDFSSTLATGVPGSEVHACFYVACVTEVEPCTAMLCKCEKNWTRIPWERQWSLFLVLETKSFYMFNCESSCAVCFFPRNQRAQSISRWRCNSSDFIGTCSNLLDGYLGTDYCNLLLWVCIYIYICEYIYIYTHIYTLYWPSKLDTSSMVHGSILTRLSNYAYIYIYIDRCI